MNDRLWVFPIGVLISILQTFLIMTVFDRIELWHNVFYFLLVTMVIGYLFAKTNQRLLVRMMSAGYGIGYIGYLYALYEARGTLFSSITSLLHYSFVFLCFTIIGVFIQRYVAPVEEE